MNMLLDFTVGNFRSFYKPKSFTLCAQKLSENLVKNTIECDKYSILKTLAFYGANSSGKTNLVRALAIMKQMVLRSVSLNDGDSLIYDPFELIDNHKEPTSFEIRFILNDVCYRYGFTYSLKKIEEEWLFQKHQNRLKDKPLFIRNNDGVACDEKKFAEGNALNANLNENRLFLSLCAQLGGEISKSIIAWFSYGINVLSGLNTSEYGEFTEQLFLKRTEVSKKAVNFFKKLQLGFDDVSVEEVEIPLEMSVAKNQQKPYPIEVSQKQTFVLTHHKIYDKDGNIAAIKPFILQESESAGTIKLFTMSGPIFDTLERGATLVIDELDAKMHPLISQQIVRLFNNPETNPKNAQLIFTTHDTHMLSSKLLRRDQIWFTEKDHTEQTDIYCLTDIVFSDGTKPRNDANYEKNYIAGRYGAIPYIIND